MSEHITHIAVLEDSITILQLAKGFHESFIKSLNKFPDSGLMGSASRGNHLYAMPIFDRVSRIWEKHTDDDLKQLAFALGWVVHRAADLIQKPIVKITGDNEKETGFLESEHEIYMDAATFKHVYQNGARKSISPFIKMSPAILETDMNSHPGAKYIDSEMLEFEMTGLFHGDLLDLHIFTDSLGGDPENWLNKFIERRQRLYEDLRLYISAFQNPDPVKWEKFITDQNYYNENDDILLLFREVQNGKRMSSINIETAIEKAKDQSQYSQMLALSYKFLKASNDFFTGSLSASAAYNILEIFPKEHRILEQ